jgi:isoquinoline 1-oxidoreductase beta subunit
VAQGLSQAQLVPRERPLAELRWWQAQAPAPTAGRARAPLHQAHEIVTGQPLFAGDIRLPGMVFGRVLRAPASPELRSQPSRWNDAAARATPGFVALVEDKRLQQANSLGLGIVARTPAALHAVAQALDVQWAIQEGAALDSVAEQIDIDRRLRQPGSLSNAVHKDTIDNADNGGTASSTANKPWDVDLRLDIPAAAHAPIEPRCAVAQPTDGPGLRLWVGTQDVFYQRDVISQRLGLDDSRVQVHGQRVGGAFGGKTVCTVELEAALLAMATQLPVKVQWTREQEFAQGFHRPPTSHRIRARLRDGRLDTWWHGFASSHILFTNAVLPSWLQRITDVIGDDGVARGAALPYRCREKRTEFDLVRLPLLTGPGTVA